MTKNILVLFFYDNKNCNDCKQQGTNILRARDSAKNKELIRIYAFDGGIESAIVESFKKATQHNNPSYYNDRQ